VLLWTLYVGVNYTKGTSFTCCHSGWQSTSAWNKVTLVDIVTRAQLLVTRAHLLCWPAPMSVFLSCDSKVKQSHFTAWRRREKEQYSSYSFVTSALDGVSGQRHAQATFTPGERTAGTHCTGGWLGPRDGLDTHVRGKILSLCRELNLDRQVVQSVVRYYTAWATPAHISW
jgi:hypothetical protein